MKVLHICETARGGVGTYIDTLIELERDTVTSKVILPDAHQEMVSALCNTSVFRYPGRSAGSILRLLGVGLREKFAFQPDIVFCHSSLSLLALCLLRLVSWRTRFIYCAHGWAGAREMPDGAKARIVRKVEGLLAGLADRVVNVSFAEMDHAQRHGYGGRQIVIENAVRPTRGVPPATVFGTESDLIHLLFVGRHDHQKGLDILLAAFVKAHRLRPDLRLHVVGESVQSKNTQAIPIAGVDFLGWVSSDQIDGYYRSADLLVVPSRWEGFGLVIPEALRNGTPVLVSDRSFLPDLITQGVTGLASPLGVDEFAAALVALNKTALCAMRASCFTLFRARFHSARLGHKMKALYADVVAQ